jgi:hypothetical protein
MAQHISRDGDLIAVHPIDMSTVLYMFVLDASWDELDKLCDDHLNLGGEVVYRPLAPFVVLYCSSAKSRPIANPIGWCPERDFGFWVPVTAGRVEDGRYVPERILMYTPYLWVDNGIAMTGGRCVYGFPKQLGRLTMPKTHSDPATFSIDCMVIPKYGPDAECVEQPIIEIAKRGGGLFEELKHLWSSGEHVFGAIGEVVRKLVSGGPLPHITPELVLKMLSEAGREVPMVFLKQFPDIGDARMACYQAIVEAPISIQSRVVGGWLTGEYRVTIHSYESHGIVERLGLKTISIEGNQSVLQSRIHGWVEFDARVERGTVVWKAD